MESFDIILKGGNLILPSQKIEKLDIGISDSCILEIGDLSRKLSKKIIDINGLTVIPGAIDTQVHFREPGLTHKEDIFHGSKSAIAGGVTTFFEMPNTSPPTTNIRELERKFKIAYKNSYCNFSFFVGASKENINKINQLESYPGCCGVKIFMGSSTGDLLVEDDESVLKILKTSKKMIAIHSEDEFILRQRKKLFLEKDLNVLDHPEIRDVTSALNCTKRLLKNAHIAKKKIHILHLTTKEEVSLLENNKNIATCEVTPQHLFFTSPECYEKLGTLAQMNPPIRDKSHNVGLWDGLTRKVIDVIGSDHAPHTLEEKSKPYPESPSGMTGVQTLLPVMLNFVNKGKLSMFDLVRLTSENPAKIYDIANKGKIKIGYDADLVVVDMNKEFIISNSWIHSKSKWTPYDGLKIKGMPVYTIINGEVAMEQNEISSELFGKKVIFNNQFL